MAPTRLSMDRFNDAVEYMINMGAGKETAVEVLKRLLPLYDGNWDYIEADNYSVLADGVFDDPDPKDGPKRQVEKNNLDPDHCSKKHKGKERGQKPKPNIHGNGNEESLEVPHQKEAKALDRKAIAAKLQKPSSQISIEEPKIETSHTEAATNGQKSSPLLLEGHGNHSFVTPLAVVCPQAPEPSPPKGLLVAREEHMADACSSQAIVSSKDFPTNSEVVLSNSGYGKLSFSFNSSLENSSGFRVPGTESICKAMEARCIRTYKILEPNFSFMKLLDDTCQCILALGSRSGDPRERSIRQILGSNAVDGVDQNDSRSMQIIQHQLPSSVKRQFHDVNDITKGEERVSIPIVSVEGALPPPFTYIPQNITFQDAYISLSLARIGDENCCSDCFGDCLAEPLPCACATETGGEFAYTRDGLLKEGFLDACVLMIQEPHKQPHFYCKICPLEKFKNEMNPDPCKGHPIRKFIKECWRKCSCSRYCGNRVVQRGITRNLQVFLTSGKKGWGLRAAEKLPRGAFVCEYVGEILTNMELYHRTMKLTGNAKHTYPVVLNADWGSERVLKDEEALCLDATFYGNVARFINHRCFDANIIDIPVEIETPDHHYFHMAFFTNREIEPFEELTWDYGIDFDDVNHPIKAFKCHCGSKFCRDKGRSRSKARALVL